MTLRGKHWWVACGGALLMLAGCGGPTAAPKPSVNVAYAGSLGPVMDLGVGPAFQRATHIAYHGRGAGSFGLAREIAAHAIAADVFYSIGVKPIKDLGVRHPWAACFASAPLVIVYNPKSPFAPTLAAIAQGHQSIQSLFSVLSQSGFKLGRTNPATDPQGQAFYLMVMLAQKLYHLPANTVSAVLGAPDNPHQVLSETSVITQVQAGTIDAASAFLPEAKSRNLPYIPLPPALDFANPVDQALYAQVHKTFPTVGLVTGHALRVCATIPPGVHAQTGTRFLAYSLGRAARAYWTRIGYEWGPPAYVGPASAVPASVKRALSS
ncbi:MAG: extracellular solute-binding protein [Thermaerobacter sp.]|nr:extracellular solute-binding protein [Thermaerobacter sp.]